MNNNLLSIVGPTATGKSDMAVYLAEKFVGEIISADSRQVYKGLDIGTGKITKDEMHEIKHYLLDVSDVRDEYTVSHFKKDGLISIDVIRDHNKLPIVCGGTGFWVDTLTRGLMIPEVPPNIELRKSLEYKSNDELFEILKTKDERRAEEIDRHNPYRLIRALEIINALGYVPEKTYESDYNLCTIGITATKEIIDARIAKRLDARLSMGMIDEIKGILDSGVPKERLIALGLEYRHVTMYLNGDYKSEKDMRNALYMDIVHFAKRQMTWFKKNKDIHWIDIGDFEKAEEIVKEFLRL
jgi:tRNA dimethylallyltransferase